MNITSSHDIFLPFFAFMAILAIVLFAIIIKQRKILVHLIAENQKLNAQIVEVKAQVESEALNKAQELFTQWKDKELEDQRRILESSVENKYRAILEEELRKKVEQVRQEYERKFNEWKAKEYGEYKKQIEKTIDSKYKAQLEEQLRVTANKIRQEYENKFNEWKAKELENLKKQIEENVKSHYEAEFKKWIQEEEKRIRNDAINKSTATILGRVGEQLAPLLIFNNYGINPKEIRFLGNPVDFIAFKGLEDGRIEEVIFIEVKSGKTQTLTPRERQIKEAIENKRVSWITFHTPTEIRKLDMQLQYFSNKP